MPTLPPGPGPGGITGTIVTVNGIQGEVLVDGARKGIEAGVGPSREVMYKVKWDESDTFMDGLIGTRTVSGGIGGASIFPVFHPYPGNVNLLCYSCSAVGVGVPGPDTVGGKLIRFSGPPGYFGYAHITAAYKRPVFDYYGNDTLNAFGGQPIAFAEYRQRGYSEPIPIPNNVLELPDGNPPPIRMKQEMPVKEYMLRLHYRAYNPETILDPLLGKTNSNVLWGKAVGTLRLAEYDVDCQVDGGGNMNAVIELRILWRPIDWNYVPDDGTLAFVLATDGAGGYIYPYISYAPILAL